MASFLLGRVAGAATLGELEIPHGQQHVQVILLALHQNGTKQGRRCSHSTWSLDDLWAGPSRAGEPVLPGPLFKICASIPCFDTGVCIHPTFYC